MILVSEKAGTKLSVYSDRVDIVTAMGDTYARSSLRATILTPNGGRVGWWVVERLLPVKQVSSKKYNVQHPSNEVWLIT
jgi:hypothetical protein